MSETKKIRIEVTPCSSVIDSLLLVDLEEFQKEVAYCRIENQEIFFNLQNRLDELKQIAQNYSIDSIENKLEEEGSLIDDDKEDGQHISNNKMDMSAKTKKQQPPRDRKEDNYALAVANNNNNSKNVQDTTIGSGCNPILNEIFGQLGIRECIKKFLRDKEIARLFLQVNKFLRDTIIGENTIWKWIFEASFPGVLECTPKAFVDSRGYEFLFRENIKSTDYYIPKPPKNIISKPSNVIFLLKVWDCARSDEFVSFSDTISLDILAKDGTANFSPREKYNRTTTSMETKSTNHSDADDNIYVVSKHSWDVLLTNESSVEQYFENILRNLEPFYSTLECIRLDTNQICQVGDYRLWDLIDVNFENAIRALEIGETCFWANYMMRRQMCYLPLTDYGTQEVLTSRWEENPVQQQDNNNDEVDFNIYENGICFDMMMTFHLRNDGPTVSLILYGIQIQARQALTKRITGREIKREKLQQFCNHFIWL